MATRVGAAYLEITARNAQLKSKLNESENISKSFTSRMREQFSSLAKSIASRFVITGADVAAVLKRVARNSVETAMKIQTLRTAFESLSGGVVKAAKNYRAFQEAARGTIAEVDALRLANSAMLLGVAKNERQMRFLALAGRRLGAAMGIDATRGVEALTLGIGRQSRLWLDNIGIIVKAEDVYEDYAAQLGKIASELTDAERKQAFMNATMTAAREKLVRLGPDIDDAATKWARYKTSWKGVAALIGKGLVNIGEGFFDLVTDITRGLRGGQQEIEAANKAIHEQQMMQIRAEQDLADLLKERALHEANIAKTKKEDLELSKKLHKEARDRLQEGLKFIEDLKIEEMRARGESAKADIRAIENWSARTRDAWHDSAAVRIQVYETAEAKITAIHKREEEKRRKEEEKRAPERAAKEILRILRIEEEIRPAPKFPALTKEQIDRIFPVAEAPRQTTAPRWMSAEQVWKEAVLAGVKNPQLEEAKKQTKAAEETNEILEDIDGNLVRLLTLE